MSEPPLFEVVATRSGARAMLDRRTGEVMHPLVGPDRGAPEPLRRPSRLEAAPVRAPESRAARAPRRGARRGLQRGGRVGALRGATRTRRTRDCTSSASTGPSRPSSSRSARSTPRRSASSATTLAACSRLLEHGRAAGAGTVWRASLGELPATLLAEPPASADVVYWDPFSPRANPELWNVAAFTALRRRAATARRAHVQRRDGHAHRAAPRRVRRGLRRGAALGATGHGRRDAPGGRLDTPLDRRWLDRLSRSSAPFSSDAPARRLRPHRAPAAVPMRERYRCRPAA